MEPKSGVTTPEIMYCDLSNRLAPLEVALKPQEEKVMRQRELSMAKSMLFDERAERNLRPWFI